MATLWRDDAGAEYVTMVDLDGTPVWHTPLPELLDPAGDRPLQPILDRVPTTEGPDWLVVTNIGSQTATGPMATRVLSLNAETGELVTDAGPAAECTVRPRRERRDLSPLAGPRSIEGVERFQRQWRRDRA